MRRLGAQTKAPGLHLFVAARGWASPPLDAEHLDTIFTSEKAMELPEVTRFGLTSAHFAIKAEIQAVPGESRWAPASSPPPAAPIDGRSPTLHRQ